MTTITITPTNAARAYIGSIYKTRQRIVTISEALMDAMGVDAPYFAAAADAWFQAVSDIAAVEAGLEAVGFFICSPFGDIASLSRGIAFSSLKAAIGTYEDHNRDANSVEVFRAVLSALGIIYSINKDSGIIIRYTYTSEER